MTHYREKLESLVIEESYSALSTTTNEYLEKGDAMFLEVDDNIEQEVIIE